MKQKLLFIAFFNVFVSLLITSNLFAQITNDYRSKISGNWGTVATWQRYNGTAWVNASVAPAAANNVTIQSGHTVTIEATSKVCNKLIIQSTGVLKSSAASGTDFTLTPGSTDPTTIIQNDGTLGGSATGTNDGIFLTIPPNCSSMTITGTGSCRISRLQPVILNPNNLVLVIDQDINLNYPGIAYSAFRNNVSNNATQNITFTINAGKTVKLTNSSGVFHWNSNMLTNPYGTFTYNINGNLDLSLTTTTSHVLPSSTSAASVVTVNVNGIFTTGTGFNTVRANTSAINGQVGLKIKNGGLINGTKLTTLTTGTNYFVTSGSGALSRKVDATNVLFPVGSPLSASPVTMANPGTPAVFTVKVADTFANPVPDPNSVVNKQWTITKDATTVTNVSVSLGWITTDQSPGFNPSSSNISLIRFVSPYYNSKSATVSGNGTVADPYKANAAGFSSFGIFGVQSGNTAFPANSGVIDVTKSPYFAKGDGVTDDTDAINLALRQNNASSTSTPTNFMSRTIYLPAGIYLVSGSLEPINISDPSKNECSVRIIGDGIDRTVIKLKDGSAGFGLNGAGKRPPAATAKYVLRTGNKLGGLPNAGFGNYIQNLTVDIGSNVGAGGIRFDVANCGSMSHVKIVSSSGANGVYGLGFFKQVGNGYVKDVTVKGFAYGIYMDDTGVNNITMEHIDLSSQDTAGIKNEGKNIQIRDLKSNNTVPAIIANKTYSATILLSATLTGGSGPAIKLIGTTSPAASPFLFVRDVTSSGYSTTIDVPAGFAKADVTTSYVAEWATHDNPLSTGGSLNLPIEDAPEYNTTDLSKWGSVVAYGATPGDDSNDDAIGIQAAIDNAGTEIVYFPYGVYDIKSDVVVRGNVKKIDFLFSQVKDATESHFIRVDNTTPSQQVVLENMVLGKVGLIQNSGRTLVVRNFGGGGKITTGTSGGGKLYVETAGPHCNIEVRNGISAWLRAVNRERVAFLNDGSTVWDFGDNVERMETDATGNQTIGSFTTINGGKSEYFGGAVDALDTKHIPSDGPLFLTDHSTLSAVYAGEYREDGIWPLHFQNISSSGSTEVDSSATIVIRYTPTSSGKRFIMPLYSVNTELSMLSSKLISFTGKSVGEQNQLNWTTASEQNNSHFNLLRSTDGKSFTSVGTIISNGTSSKDNDKDYSLTDQNPALGINYYQLQRVSFNGTLEKSEVVAIKPAIKEDEFKIYVTTDNQLQVSVYVGKAGQGIVRVTDLIGRTLINTKLHLEKGYSTFKLPANELVQSVLFVGTLLHDGKLQSVKFVK